jgi:hypothetical protein
VGPCEWCCVLDLFYLAIGAAGFVALWAIAVACDRT